MKRIYLISLARCAMYVSVNLSFYSLKGHIMTRILSLILVILGATALASCQTIQGAGQDLENAGQGLEDATDG